ncbi:MAG: hypothetical protein M3527_05760, partial [Actinomycetota bacterium]|nr:hypothetical protein [Actinomycetota bacterium]
GKTPDEVFATPDPSGATAVHDTVVTDATPADELSVDDVPARASGANLVTPAGRKHRTRPLTG